MMPGGAWPAAASASAWRSRACTTQYGGNSRPSACARRNASTGYSRKQARKPVGDTANNDRLYQDALAANLSRGRFLCRHCAWPRLRRYSNATAMISLIAAERSPTVRTPQRWADRDRQWWVQKQYWREAQGPHPTMTLAVASLLQASWANEISALADEPARHAIDFAHPPFEGCSADSVTDNGDNLLHGNSLTNIAEPRTGDSRAGHAEYRGT
jgi:hypothetical protein